MSCPRELLSHDLNFDRLLVGPGRIVDRPGPKRHSEANQQHGLHHCYTDLQVGRSMAADTHVIGFGIGNFVEAKHYPEEVSEPSRKQRTHEQMHVQNQLIDAIAMGRSHFRHSKISK